MCAIAGVDSSTPRKRDIIIGLHQSNIEIGWPVTGKVRVAVLLLPKLLMLRHLEAPLISISLSKRRKKVLLTIMMNRGHPARVRVRVKALITAIAMVVHFGKVKVGHSQRMTS